MSQLPGDLKMPPKTWEGLNDLKTFVPALMTWLVSLRYQQLLHGTTAQRPTTNLTLWMQYGDDTLGKPVWLKSMGPSVWVDATGAAV